MIVDASRPDRAAAMAVTRGPRRAPYGAAVPMYTPSRPRGSSLLALRAAAPLRTVALQPKGRKYLKGSDLSG